ncbi:MAG: hypothetical protein ABIH66_14175 [bacterium]
MKRFLTVIITVGAFCMFIICSGAAYAQDISMGALPPELQDTIENLLSTRWPPVVDDVTLDPEEPAEDEEVTITVTTKVVSNESTDYTSEAVVVYSTDGGETWDEIELEEGDDDTEWIGTFPGFESGTEVIYGIRAVDSSDNVYVELPCEPAEWPPADEYIEEDCVAEEDFSACGGNLPRYCMFPMSKDDEGDDEDSVVPADLDFWESRVGQSEDKYYADLVVEGKIYEGTISPMDIYLYAVLIINPDKGEAESIGEILDKGIVLAYVPNIDIAGGMLPPGADKCMIIWKEGNDAAFDNDSITCKKKKNHLFIDFDKEMAFDNPSEYLTWVMINGHATNIDPFEGKPGNFTHFTNVSTISRSFTVE